MGRKLLRLSSELKDSIKRCVLTSSPTGRVSRGRRARRADLASIIDEARVEPVYLTRRNRPVAAVIDSGQLERLLEDAEELADIRAVDADTPSWRHRPLWGGR
ncbi:type II toxin-antitoxin system Phd/YefM family antitoxin [Leifsonia sp. 2MCAF36]|uniref:type II toxin-antitoxin system Phd/YefM family antitoxin n=1 Tax=Leifsonia sp. 2MCAF36 TaxID=3232988 RepID=UPI003F9A5676